MPSHFDRFRLLNGSGKDLTGVRYRNESDHPVVLHGDHEVHIPPGGEEELPPSASGEIEIVVEVAE